MKIIQVTAAALSPASPGVALAPKAQAQSDQQGSFLAGGEYPVPVRNGSDITYECRPFGVDMSLTLRVLDEKIINVLGYARDHQDVRPGELT